MAKKRRKYPDYYLVKHQTSTCLCGCLQPVQGRALYASIKCRVAMHRLRVRLESKHKKITEEA